MTQSEKLLTTMITSGGNYKASSSHMPVIDPIDHCTVVPCRFKIGAGYSTLLSTIIPHARSIQLGLFNGGVHGNVALKLSPSEWYFPFATFRCTSFFINRCRSWTTYGLWKKMRYQNVDEKIPRRSLFNMFNYGTIQNPDLQLWLVIQVRTFFIWRCVFWIRGIYNCKFSSPRIE